VRVGKLVQRVVTEALQVAAQFPKSDNPNLRPACH